MNTIIIEDEPLVARDLQKLLREVAPQLNIIRILGSLEACLEYFGDHEEPDLLLMDVQLSDGVSFDLLQAYPLNCPIIFTTAYDEYAIRAFKLNSIDYLLKPIDKQELILAIDKFNKWKSSNDFDFKNQFQKLLEQINQPKEEKIFKERFIVHSGKSLMIVNQDSIAYFLKDEIIFMITKDKQKFVTDYNTLEEIEDILNPALFFRANRQMILQLDGVEGFKTDLYGKLIVKLKAPLDTPVDISREKAQAFKKWLE